MAPIPSRWHAGQAALRPYDTPARQVALAFALYGIRRQLADHVPGETEATVTVTDTDGRSLGRLTLDEDDVKRLSGAITGLIDEDFGPIERDDLHRVMAEYDET